MNFRLYQYLARSLFFRFDPEWIHEKALSALRLSSPLKAVIKSHYACEDPRLHQTIWGLKFHNPIGLAGGFDKNATAIDLLDMFGFSFAEIGTVTPEPQEGNPKPRIFRYPQDQAIVNRMGFNNEGSLAIARRLQSLGEHNLIIGISLGKQKDTPINTIDQVIADYLMSLERLYPYGDYFAVNVSSPNTENLRDLQSAESLEILLGEIKQKMRFLSNNEQTKPLCVKFAPDLTNKEIQEAIKVCQDCHIDGIIATNTTSQTGNRESGGLSGAPLRQRSTEVIRFIAERVQGEIPIIGCGGIFTSKDALEKLHAGASLLQLYTGFIYQGPAIVKEIKEGLISHFNENQIKNIFSFR